MNGPEAVAVLRKACAYCPAMRSNEDTRRAWAEALARVDYADALEAVATLGARTLAPGEQLWIQPGHVLAEVRRIRARRLEAGEADLTGAPTDPEAYLAWLRAQRRQVASGQQPPSPPQLTSPMTTDRRAQLQLAITSVARATRP